MKENEPILELTKDAVRSNVATFVVILTFLLSQFSRIRRSTREFNACTAIFFILSVASIVFVIPICSKKYVYDDSILNSIPRKIPITVNIFNIATALILIALWLLSFSSILPTSFGYIYMYIVMSLFLLSLTVQIYYYSKMKIAYFFIMLAGAFLIEFFLVSHYTLHTVTGAMGILILIAALLIASDVVIYKNA